MPSPQLQRKLDILSRSATPKVLLDVVFLLVSELDKREQEQRHTDNSIVELELATKDPSRDVQRDLQSLRQSLDTLRRDTQQLEHTIREAEASFTAQYEVKRAEVDEAVRDLRSTCERLLRDEVPSSLSAQLQRVTSASRDITAAVLSTTASSLRDLKQEVVSEVEDAVKHHCAAALDQLQEECQVAVFASMRRVELDFDKLRNEMQIASANALRDLHHHTAQCSEFLGEKVAKTLHAEPLLDVHALMAEVQYCAAQLQFFRDTSCSNVEAALIRGKLAALEASTTALRVEQRGVVGFVSLWDADADVLDEMADISQQQGRHGRRGDDERISKMKAEYLRRLPALSGFALVPPVTTEEQAYVPRHVAAAAAARTPPPVSTPSNLLRTPIPDALAKSELLRELSVHKNSEATDIRASHRRRPAEPHINESMDMRSVPAELHRLEDDSIGAGGSVAGVFAALFPSREPATASYNLPDGRGGSTYMPNSSRSDEDGIVVEMGDVSPISSSKAPQPQHLGLVVSDADPLSGGVIVSRVMPQSLMERHGVGADDQVLSINGAMITDRDHMGSVLAGITAGSTMRMHFFRPATAKMFVVQATR